MASVVVVGGSGYAGSAVVAEAIDRGHEVVSISRTIPETPLPGADYRALDVTAETPDLDAAAVVVATLSPRGATAGKVPDAYRRLAEAAKAAGARFIMLGGFSSLRPEAGAARFAEGDGIPAEYRDEALEMNGILQEFLAADAALGDWLFVSPAGDFGAYAPGVRTGEYRVADDVVLVDDSGRSALSAQDLAVAILDEVASPTRRRQQIHFAY